MKKVQQGRPNRGRQQGPRTPPNHKVVGEGMNKLLRLPTPMPWSLLQSFKQAEESRSMTFGFVSEISIGQIRLNPIKRAKGNRISTMEMMMGGQIWGYNTSEVFDCWGFQIWGWGRRRVSILVFNSALSGMWFSRIWLSFTSSFLLSNSLQDGTKIENF